MAKEASEPKIYTPKEVKNEIHTREKVNNDKKVEENDTILNEELASGILDELDITNSSSTSRRNGPRVKNVSRHSITLNQSLHPYNQLQKLGKTKYYNYLKLLNDDDYENPSSLLTWQSFVSDLEPDLVLSVYPADVKSALVKKLGIDTYHSHPETTKSNERTTKSPHSRSQSFIASLLNAKKTKQLNISINQQTNQLTQSNSPSLSFNNSSISNKQSESNETKASLSEDVNQVAASLKSSLNSSSNNTRSSKFSEFTKRKKSNFFMKKRFLNNKYKNLSHSPVNKFDWDDYFEKNHHISTNQNFRMSSLLPADTNTNHQGVLNENNESQTTIQNSMSGPIVKKRFRFKLNSYKDRYHPYVQMDNPLHKEDQNSQQVSSNSSSGYDTSKSNTKQQDQSHDARSDHQPKNTLIFDLAVSCDRSLIIKFKNILFICF